MPTIYTRTGKVLNVPRIARWFQGPRGEAVVQLLEDESWRLLNLLTGVVELLDAAAAAAWLANNQHVEDQWYALAAPLFGQIGGQPDGV